MPIPGMGALVAQSKKKFGLPDKKQAGPPKDGVHPFGKGGPGGGAPGDGKKQDARAVAKAQAAKVASGKVDGQLRKLMKGFDPESDGYPKWAKDEHTWKEAEEAVDPDGAGKKIGADPWLVVAHVYKALGGKIDGGGGDDGDHDHEEPDGDEGKDGGGKPFGGSKAPPFGHDSGDDD